MGINMDEAPKVHFTTPPWWLCSVKCENYFFTSSSCTHMKQFTPNDQNDWGMKGHQAPTWEVGRKSRTQVRWRSRCQFRTQCLRNQLRPRAKASVCWAHPLIICLIAADPLNVGGNLSRKCTITTNDDYFCNVSFNLPGCIHSYLCIHSGAHKKIT